MEITTNVGVINNNHKGMWLWSIWLMKKIDVCQKDPLSRPIKVSLNKNPANKAPIIKTNNGINIIAGDSWASSIGVFLLL